MTNASSSSANREPDTIKISIITSTWNCAGTAEDCLASVAHQTYADREYVVIDGASTDGTLELLQSHGKQIDVLISEPDDGIYDALNKGIASASGDVIGFLHADDIYASEEILSKVASAFEADESLSAVYGDLDYVSKDNTDKLVRRWKSSPFTSRSLSRGWMPPHPTLYVRREWYERIGSFDTRYKIAADYFSILQLFGHYDFRSQYLPEVLVKMRCGGASNRSVKAIARKSVEDWNALKRSGHGLIGRSSALILKNLGKIGQFVDKN